MPDVAPEPQRPARTLSRREFTRRLVGAGAVAGAWGVGAAVLHDRRSGLEQPEPAGPLPDYRAPLPAGRARLVVCHGQDIDRMVRAAVDAMGGLERFVARGDRVVLKPNVAFDRAPSLAATTAPDLVECVARLCYRAGAAEVTVLDHPINHNDAPGCFQRTGIGPAARRAGARVLFPRPWSFADVRLAEARALGRWPVFREPLDRATRLIGLAPVKDHNLSGASIVMKNWYGLLGGRREQLHQRIHDTIADLALMVRPTLVIADARRLLVANGPTGGSMADVRRTDAIVAGVDQVAVDTYAAGLLGKDVDRIEYLARAESRGLGSRAWRSIGMEEIRL